MIADEKVITALLTSPNIRSASKACGLSESALYARLRKSAFKEKYDHARMSLIEGGSNMLLQRISEAVETLGYLAGNAQSEQVRLNASEAVIRSALRLNEQADILKRLERLEEGLRDD